MKIITCYIPSIEDYLEIMMGKTGHSFAPFFSGLTNTKRGFGNKVLDFMF